MLANRSLQEEDPELFKALSLGVEREQATHSTYKEDNLRKQPHDDLYSGNPEGENTKRQGRTG